MPRSPTCSTDSVRKGVGAWLPSMWNTRIAPVCSSATRIWLPSGRKRNEVGSLRPDTISAFSNSDGGAAAASRPTAAVTAISRTASISSGREWRRDRNRLSIRGLPYEWMFLATFWAGWYGFRPRRQKVRASQVPGTPSTPAPPSTAATTAQAGTEEVVGARLPMPVGGAAPTADPSGRPGTVEPELSLEISVDGPPGTVAPALSLEFTVAAPASWISRMDWCSALLESTEGAAMAASHQNG